MSTLNVTESPYNAAGDGTTDDSSAIHSALTDASNGDTVYMPANTYNVEGQNPIELQDSNVADNVTWEGDGEGTIISYGGGNGTDNNTTIIEFDQNGNTVSGWLVQDFEINANSANVDGDPNVATALAVRDGGVWDGTIKNIEVYDAYVNGISVKSGGVTVNQCTSRDNGGHGFALDGGGTGSNKCVVKNCLAKNNSSQGGNYGFDLSNGDTDLIDSVTTGSNYHGFKTTGQTNVAVIKRLRVVSPSLNGYTRPNTNASSVSDVTFEDIVVDSAGDHSFYLSQDTQYTVNGEIVVTNTGSGKQNDFNVTSNTGSNQGAEILAGDGQIYINRSSSGSNYLRYASPNKNSTIDVLSETQNNGGLNNNGNLTNNTTNNTDKTDINGVPTESEVGAWSGSDGDSTPTPTPTPDDSFDDWTPRWASTSDDWSVVSDSTFAGDHALRFDPAGTEQQRYLMTWDNTGEPSDVEVLDKFRVPNFASDSNWGYHARVYLRAYNSGGYNNGYWLEVEDPQDGFRLGKYTDGDGATLKRFGTPAEDTFYYRRFRANGDTLKVKVWQASDPEPSSWDVEVTDGDHTGGWVGLGSWDPQSVETDVISVGTDGESAPGPDADPSVSWINPSDGETVSESLTVQVDASDQEDPEDTLTVEFRIDGGSWRSTTYNSETGYHEDAWDTTTVGDGDHTLEAQVTDSNGNTASSAVTVTVANSLSVATVNTETVTDTSVTLVGELLNLGGASDATVYFEWRESGASTWSVVGEQTLSSTGQYSADLTGLSAGTTYEFQAVAETDEKATGSIVSFDTESGSSSISIDRFDVIDKSNPSWSWYEIDWAVSDSDGNLDTVVSELLSGGTTVAAESTNISGSSANFTHELRVKGPVDELTLSVNDTSNDSITESKSV